MIPLLLLLLFSHPVVSNSLRPHGLQPSGLLCPWGFRQEYWGGLPFPSPGDLPNPGPPHCRQILYHLSHQGSPHMREGVRNGCSFFLFLKNLFIDVFNFWLCWVFTAGYRLSLVVASGSRSLIAVCRLPVVAASLVEHGP